MASSAQPAAEDVSNKHFVVVVLTDSLSPAQKPTPQESMKQEVLRQPKATKQGDTLKTGGCASLSPQFHVP